MNKLTQLQKDAIKEAIKLDELKIEHKNALMDILNIHRNKEMHPKLFVDGAADLHSKTAGIGGVVYIDDNEVASFSEPLYDKTNNESEYLSLIKGIKVIHELKFDNVCIYSDSELVVKQVTGEYKIKNDRMKKLNEQVKLNLTGLATWSVEHVRREKNTRADELSKIGMEKARGSK